MRYAIKHGVTLFNRPFSDVAKEYLAKQKARVKRGQITDKRIGTLAFVIDGPLND